MTIHPAHNDPSEKPVPIQTIRDTHCINCKRAYSVDAHITYTILHDKTVLWWHRRRSEYHKDPCNPDDTNYLKSDEHTKKKQKEYREKRKSLRKQRPEQSA